MSNIDYDKIRLQEEQVARLEFLNKSNEDKIEMLYNELLKVKKLAQSSL